MGPLQRDLATAEGQRESPALLLIDRLFEQCIDRQKKKNQRHEGDLSQRQEERRTENAAPPAAVPQDWGEADELIERFVREEENHDAIVDLNSLPEDVSVRELQKLAGRVCRYRCLVHQPMNAEYYLGAIACTRKDGSWTWRTTKYRDWLPSIEKAEEPEAEKLTPGGAKQQETRYQQENQRQERKDSAMKDEKREAEAEEKAEEARGEGKKQKDSDEEEGKTAEPTTGAGQGEEAKAQEEEREGERVTSHHSPGATDALTFEAADHPGEKTDRGNSERDARESQEASFASEERFLQGGKPAAHFQFHASEIFPANAGSNPPLECFYLRNGEWESSGELQGGAEKQFRSRAGWQQRQLWTRWPYRCIAVPGETGWCREAAAAARCSAAAAAARRGEAPSDPSTAAEKREGAAPATGAEAVAAAETRTADFPCIPGEGAVLKTATTETPTTGVGSRRTTSGSLEPLVSMVWPPCPFPADSLGKKTMWRTCRSNTRGLLGCTVVLYAQPHGQKAARCSSRSSIAEESKGGEQQQEVKKETRSGISSSSARLLLCDVIEVYGILSVNLLQHHGLTATAFASSSSVADSDTSYSRDTPAEAASSSVAPACVCGQGSSPSLNSACGGALPCVDGVVAELAAAPQLSPCAAGDCGVPACSPSESIAAASTASRASSPPTRAASLWCSPGGTPPSSSGKSTSASASAAYTDVRCASPGDPRSNINMWDLRLHAFHVKKVRNFCPAVEVHQRRAAATQQQQGRGLEADTEKEEAAAGNPQHQTPHKGHLREQQVRDENAKSENVQRQLREGSRGELQQQRQDGREKEPTGKVEKTRQALLQFLMRATYGDKVAAEYVLLALCSRHVLLQGEGDVLHTALRVNLVFPEKQQDGRTGSGELAHIRKEVQKAKENAESRDRGDRCELGEKGREGAEREERKESFPEEVKDEREKKENSRPSRSHDLSALPQYNGHQRKEEQRSSQQRIHQQQVHSQEQQHEQQQPRRQQQEREKARGNCCCCSLSESSRRLLKALEVLVPRLRGFALLPENLFKRRLTCRLLPGNEEDDEEAELTRGVLQMASGTVLLIEEPRVCTGAWLAAACRRHAVVENKEGDTGEDEKECTAQPGGTQKSQGSCGECIVDKRNARENSGTDAREERGKAGSSADQKEKTAKYKEEATRLRTAQLQSAAREELQALHMLFSEAAVPVSYGYAETRVPTDVSIICVSFSEPTLFADYAVVLPVSTHCQADTATTSPKLCEETDAAGMTAFAPSTDGETAAAAGEEADTLSWRCLIGQANGRDACVCIDSGVRATIIQDWVRLRQTDASIKSDDLSRWLILADAMAASYGEGVNGEGSLKVEHWRAVLKLEAERRERIKRTFS